MNLRLTRAIQQILLAGTTVAFTAGVVAAVGQQNPPPGPGHVPDYFGVVPNFANSPQPVLSTVTITDANQAVGGLPATAAATTYDYTLDMPTTGITDIKVLNGGSGYSQNPTVTINSGNPAATAATATATVANGLISSFTVTAGGTGYSASNAIATISGDGTGATAIPLVDATGAITGVQVTNPGSGYTNANVTFGSNSGTLPLGDIPLVGANQGQSYYAVPAAGMPQPPAPTVTITDATGQNALAVANVDTNPFLADGVTANPTFGHILSITITNGGFGYSATPTITINGTGTGAVGPTVSPTPAGAGTGALATANILDGVITGFTLTNTTTHANGLAYAGEGYNIPMPGTGIHKFVDALPGLTKNGVSLSSYAPTANGLGQSLPIAVADVTTFPAIGKTPAADYYEIAEVEYMQQLHSDLPATKLRGYVQLVANDTPGSTDINNVATTSAAAGKYSVMGKPSYLGPIIVADKDRPVRIKLVNILPIGAAGQLPLPVDTTYMGSDTANATDNRTALHMHGGNTPWISDGTPRQWVKPAGEAGANRGETTRDVPDMWFDASGKVIPAALVPADPIAAGYNNNPGDGATTYYFTNQQSARLMFYHDHTEGLTRLNVYDGLAGGYILEDPTEQAMISGGTAQQAALAMGYSVAEQAKYDSVTNYTAATIPPLADTIPLIIQEKTFVPNDTNPVLNFYGAFASQLNSQDPTWRWGTDVSAASAPLNPVKGQSWFDTTNNQLKVFDGAAWIPSLRGNGNLWVPHIFMPNQNPGDITGANAMGRWDYGPWFWPPFTNIQNGALANPYFDPTCNTTTSYCEGPEIPGVPNGSLIANGGGVFDIKTNAKTESPSATPESFNDTPLVNGTAYPYINVDPKQYRFRILSVGNDRMLNLSLVVAASKTTDTTAEANRGLTGNQAVLCDGITAVSANQADCTEVKMVPFDAAQNKAKLFPSHWYTTQKAGVTFDGRPSGVFDPASRGPAMVQIGTEGGFLSSPVVIRNQPVNYEYNPKNILIGNIKEHALLLGPAERADVVVDFSNYAGSTLILYNDAGAPVPAWDLRLDYFTGGFDNTDTGGAFSTIPGYGPNSRTIMQIRVSTNGGIAAANLASSRDSTGTIPVTVNATTGAVTGGALTTAVRNAFKTAQDPIIVPQAAYNATYGTNVADVLGGDLSAIASSSLNFKPLVLDVNGHATTSQVGVTTVNLEMKPKSIIEDWTMNWGRMNALLGTEVPRTNATIQTSIPQAFIDPPTELVKITPNTNATPISGTLADGTTLWKVTHNGVDSHSIHFHLFNVQLVNRVGWDGAIYPPELNELGWKDSVLMHPLSDVIVALRPMTMVDLPFKVANSHRKIDPSNAAVAVDFFNLNPMTGNASNALPANNASINYGWEYLWHCHILGHEENDMMRSIAVAQPPEAPTGLGLTAAANGNITLAWTDNSVVSNWVEITRSTDGIMKADGTGFQTVDATFNVVEPECTSQTGCARNYPDNTALPATSYYYRVVANNTVGGGEGRADKPLAAVAAGGWTYGENLPAGVSSLLPNIGGVNGYTGYANVTASSDAVTASRVVVPTAVVTAGPLTFSSVINTTSAAQTVTVQNTGTGNLAIASVALSPVVAPAVSNFAIANACPASLAPLASCNISVTFKPTVTGPLNDTLTITDNTGNVVGSTQTVTLNGTGTAPIAGVTGALAFGNVNVGATSAVQTVTLSNTGTAPLSIASIVAPAQFAQTNNCGTSLAAPVAPALSTTCTISVTFKPTTAGAAAGNLVITDNTNGVTGSLQNVALTGTGVQVGPTVPAVVRDTFNRGNANNLGNTWQQTGLAGLSVLRVNNNQATANAAGLTGYAYSNTVGTATQGAGFTFANGTVNNTALFLKASGALGNGSGQLQNAIKVSYNAGNVTVATTTNGNNNNPNYTNVGAAINTGGALANGNSLLAAVDNTGKVWVWKVVGATTTLLTPAGVQLPNNALWTTGGGKVGMQLPNGARVDNFVAY